jgi:hypothetical protein
MRSTARRTVVQQGTDRELCNRNIEEGKHIPWTKEGYKTDMKMYSWTDRCNIGG